MKILRVLAGALILAGISSGCNSLTGKDPEQILGNVAKAIDPQNKRKDLKTEIVQSEVKTFKKEEGKLTVKRKNPGLIRIEFESKDAVLIKAFNGSKGWEFSSGKGYRELEGKELGTLKLQAVFPSLLCQAGKIFSSIKSDGDGNAAGTECYKFVCTPISSYDAEPITVYIDKKIYHILKTEQGHWINGQNVLITTLLENYSDFDGMMFPANIVSEADGSVRDVNILGIKFNEDIPSSEFDPPVKLGNQ